MNFASTQFVPSRRMGICEPLPQIGMWSDYKENNYLDTSTPAILEVDSRFDNQSEDTSHGIVEPSNKYDQEVSKTNDKQLRRLAQNREAARKCRLRKKAYVQQLENSKLRLMQLEQELERARQQGLYVGGGLDTGQLGYSRTTNPDLELSSFVDDGMNHYFDLFLMKETAAKADVFYLMSGMWETSAEHFLSWIGGFRPSELLKVLEPHLGPLTEKQSLELSNLKQSCQQAEDALSQGLERLHQILSETVADGLLGEGNYLPQINAALEKLKAMVRFVGQADHLRKETLLQISRNLNNRQAAQGLLALGEYFQRLRVLSSFWTSRPRESS
ncbi:TGACG-sequence-specific DNA-binding protein TGA-1A-like isoform X4 [Olea europaea var. sylvestris]|uniref:TGACG-sequence-specific DNA-binding protein TGA-1A-like isoform X4 n=1 Tax=Olea europaea var. sylvestris TaxID=158386 RepID=UPI000C1D86E2|nr:TGACG-sequence-specific DNA-binding protein TGA-1A-like isoform X4 [Olea europaea var. sylvestris]